MKEEWYVRIVQAPDTSDEDKQKAFAHLSKRFRAQAIHTAQRILSDKSVVEDVVQESFLEAYNSIHHLESPNKFGPWLKQIVRHQCYRVMRKRQNSLVAFEPDTHPNPQGSSHLETADVKRHVQHALLALPEQQRQATSLYMEGYTHKDIASFLELSLHKTNHALRDARKHLREHLRFLAHDLFPHSILLSLLLWFYPLPMSQTGGLL